MPSDDPRSELEQFCSIFLRHGVEFIVIGGQAEYLHGSPRATYDWDFCYRRTPANLKRLSDALRELRPTLRNAPPNLPVHLNEQALSLGDNFTFNTELGPLDLLCYLEPIGTYDDIVDRAERYEVGDMLLNVISLDDLITIKRHLGRPKDQQSLLQLLAIKQVREEETS